MKDFFEEHNWFRQKYEKNLDCRYKTMYMALFQMAEQNGKTFVETGTTRLENDWGGGMSTYVLGDFLTHYGGMLTTVDIEPKAIEVAKKVTDEFKSHIVYVVEDSLRYLSSYGGPKIDLLYLDSYDYPYFELLDFYGGKEDLDKAVETIKTVPEEEIVRLYNLTIGPSQEHQLKELKLALPLLSENAVILLDDNELPGGGKTRLSKQYLKELGWVCLLDSQQSLWTKNG